MNSNKKNAYKKNTNKKSENELNVNKNSAYIDQGPASIKQGSTPFPSPDIPASWWIFALSISIGGIVVGSRMDYTLDFHLYQPDTFWARFLAAYGPLPCFWWLMAAGLSLGSWPDLKSGWKKYGSRLLCWIDVIGSILYIAKAACDPLHLPFGISLVLALLLAGIPACMMYWQMERTDLNLRKKMVWCILLVCAGQFVIVHTLKPIVSRPRFLAIVADPNAPFLNWWQNGLSVKKEFASLAAQNPDLFQSFPSGHTASAACSFLGCLLAWTSKKAHVKVMFAAALLFTILVALSRMVLGYHYLSDVSFGFLIGYGLFFAGWNFILKDKAKDQNPVIELR